MSLVSGSLGKYQIIREIARSNDVVYEAYDPALNRRVALKELLVPTGATPAQAYDRVKRFEREARAAGTLSHPNIVTIHEVGHDGDRHFIAMEYLEGESLRQRLDNVGALGEAEATRVMSQVLEGLAYAHDKGIVHRDIKPDNIHILPDGRVKITDFGIARITFETKLTVTGQIFGTPSYMSPEQVHGEDVDVRSDVWSAGVVFYEAICGAKPFAGGSVIAIAQSVLHDNPPDPPGASYGIVELIRTALNKSPDARFANAGVMLNALRGQSQLVAPPPVQQAVGNPQPQQQQVFVPPGGQQQTKNPASLVGWGIAVVLLGIVVFSLNRPGGHPAPIEPKFPTSPTRTNEPDTPSQANPSAPDDSRRGKNTRGESSASPIVPDADTGEHLSTDGPRRTEGHASESSVSYNSIAKFEWLVPDGWVESRAKTDGTYERWLLYAEQHVYAFVDVVFGDSEDEFAETLRQEKHWKAHGVPFVRITLDRTTFLGHDAAFRVYEKSIGGRWVRRHVLYFRANGNGYALGFHAPPERWQEYASDFERILNTFELR